ncbi:MAG: ureidoglycolate hydrolase [Clostridia bacterium]|jgi:ureidoglycolate lyase|nr:ureidoglycolate hydrolase [Clostridia bacterium]MBT7122231.1 ureidoglycolate hydrolase [Clostridia bacterium]
MRSVKIKKLTIEAFARYGTFASVMEPTGDKLGAPPVEFYRDMVQQDIGCGGVVSYSACVVGKRDWVIDCTESHDYCYETIICLDGDYLMHVAPACTKDELPYDNIEVFLVPKGTVMNVKKGVWHQAGFPYKCDKVHILCALPERAYATDCFVLNIPKEHQIKVLDEME